MENTVTCPNCKVRIKKPDLDIRGQSSELDFVFLKAPCPICGTEVAVPYGSFKFDDKGVKTILNGPEFTTEILQKIQHVTEVAHKEKYTPEKYKQEIASIGVPDTFLKLVIPENASDFYGFLSFLATVIFGVLALRHTKGSTNNNLKSAKKINKQKKKKNNTKKSDSDMHKLRRDYHKKNK